MSLFGQVGPRQDGGMPHPAEAGRVIEGDLHDSEAQLVGVCRERSGRNP
ncbi:MAG: hypothetical protein JWP46_1642 [Modestobacter sp.]|jgi:hypothetical protein|nr:hypothetical protein [Modestobacter sp.]